MHPRDSKSCRHRLRIRGTLQTQKGPPPRETPGCPVGGRAKSVPTPPPSCLGRDFRVRADSINGQAAAGRGRSRLSQRFASPQARPRQAAAPSSPPLGRQGAPAACSAKAPALTCVVATRGPAGAEVGGGRGRAAPRGQDPGICAFESWPHRSCAVQRQALVFTSLCFIQTPPPKAVGRNELTDPMHSEYSRS